MKRALVIVALAGALTLGFYVNAGGQAGNAPAPTRVAVVNLQKVIDNCDPQAKFRADNQAKAQALQTEQQQRQQEIATLQNGLDPFEPGTDAWNQQREKLQQKTLEMQVWVQMQENNNQLERARQIAAIYEAVNQASAAVAQDAGYDVVLQAGDLANLTQLNAQQLLTVMQTREVLYASDAVDITNAVLQRVNSDF